MSHWEGKHFVNIFHDRRLQRRNIECKQQTDISDKKLFSKAIQSQTNVKVFLRKSILLAQMLRVTIAVSQDSHRGWSLDGHGNGQEVVRLCQALDIWNCYFLSQVIVITLVTSKCFALSSCFLTDIRYCLQSWMKLQITMKSFSSPPSSTLTNCCTTMASTRRRK